MKLNPLARFNLVFSYILVFVLWWGVLLYQKNQTLFTEKLELLHLAYPQLQNNSLVQSNEYLSMKDKYERQRIMIFSEGLFFLLVVIGSYFFVRRALVKDSEFNRRQQNFLLSISHELKSPLSSIKLVLQTLGNPKLNEEQAKKLIDNSIFDVDRLENLIGNLLLAAKLEEDKYQYENKEFNLSKLSNEIVNQLKNGLKKNIDINGNIENDIMMYGDRSAVMSIIYNFLENAVKYSPEGSKVEFSLSQNNKLIRIAVSDNGNGISNREKKKIFDRFYRVGDENTRSNKGTGLGLYIVARIAEYYRAHLHVEDNKPKGVVFSVEFPRSIKK